MTVEVTITDINEIIAEQIQEYLENSEDIKETLASLIQVDDKIDGTSTNPVQNKVIYEQIYQEIYNGVDDEGNPINKISDLELRLAEIESKLNLIIGSTFVNNAND